MRGSTDNYSCIEEAAKEIKRGNVIAYPTEAVWGIGCDPWSEKSVKKILELKSRSINKGFILIAEDIKVFSMLLKNLPIAYMKRLHATWPGPYTWVVPHQNLVPNWITGDKKTVALRVTNHPLVCQLCKLTGPIVSTSANPLGMEPALSKEEVKNYFQSQVDYILDGNLGKQQNPTLIIDIVTNNIIRPG